MRPNLLKINPATQQAYTASELAEINLQQRFSKLDNTAFGGMTSVSAGGKRDIVSDDSNDFFDYSRSGYILGNDNVETRAQLQPWSEQLLRSGAKMGTTAVTTFLDGTVGVLAGLGNMAFGDREQGAFNRFIDNPFSNAMLDMQEHMEKTLPNYQTKEEQEAHFLKNAFSASGAANFWGESIIKNLGFAIGAIGAGALTGAIGAEVSGLNRLLKSSKVLEGLAKTAQQGKTLTQAEAAAVKTLSSEALGSSRQMAAVEEMAEWATKIKSKTAMNQFVSSFVGAVGESRIEALSNGRQFKETRLAELDEALNSGAIDENEYKAAAANLDKEETNYQNSVFLSNLALLSVSNYAQFRNVFAKSYNPSKIARNAVTQTAEGLYEATKRSKLQKGWDVAKLLKNPLAEMTEEQGQVAIQKGMDSYYSLKRDPDANFSINELLTAYGNGLKEAYGSEEGWESAFSGFLIGAFGVPTIGPRKSGKYGLILAGGIKDDYREAKEGRARIAQGVETVNTLLQDNPLRTLYDTAVVDVAYEKMFDQAIEENDRVNARLISNLQLTNLTDAFISIGRFEDFITRIKDETELSATEIRQKYRTKITDPLQGEKEIDFFNNMTDDQVIEYIKNKSETAVTRAEQIKKIKEDIDIRFGKRSSNERKELLLKASSLVDMDDRIDLLLREIRDETAGSYYRGLENIKDNVKDPRALVDHLEQADFSAFLTPLDLEKFLKKKDGLKNYTRLIKEYLEYQPDHKKKIAFAEKARDLYELISKRQEFNDEYFKMAVDDKYASNKEAAAKSAEINEELANRASDDRENERYAENTEEDHPEWGFSSTEFQVNLGAQKTIKVGGIKTNKDGSKTAIPPVEVIRKDDSENSRRVHEATGDVYQDYIALNDKGEEVKIQIPNAEETETVEDKIVKLQYRKGEKDRLYDEDGNAYSIQELAKNPTFLDTKEGGRTKLISIDQQKKDIINGVREKTLNQLLTSNETLLRQVMAQADATAKDIADTKTLIERAKKNKSGKVFITVNGVKTAKKIIELEVKLNELEAKLNEFTQQRRAIWDNNSELMYKLEQAKAKGFAREHFDKDIKALGKQIEDIDSALKKATEHRDKLASVIQSLKNLIKSVYPRFIQMFEKRFGVHPFLAFETNSPDKWETEVLMTIINAEESKRYEQIRVKEKELDDILKEIESLEKYKQASLDFVEKIKAEQAHFEAELAVVLKARRDAQEGVVKEQQEKEGKNTSSGKQGPEIEEEITHDHEQRHIEYTDGGRKKSQHDMSSTAGQHIDKNGVINPDTAQQRWYRAAAKVKLDKGNFMLRVITDHKLNPEIFSNVPEHLKDEAIAVVLYKDGKPVNENFEEINFTDTPRLVYTFISKATLDTESGFGARYYDAVEGSEETKALQEKYEQLRQELLTRGAAKKDSFLKITSKSKGILNRSRNFRKDPDNDLTHAVWNHLFTGTEDEMNTQMRMSRIEVAQATNEADQKAGVAYLHIGGKPVRVRNGLTYLITGQDQVIPLISRKLTEDEIETIFNLLTVATTSATISLSPTGEPETKEDKEDKKSKKGKPKSIFKALRFQPTAAQIKAGKSKDKYKGVFYNKKAKKYGFYKTTTARGKGTVVKKDTNVIEIIPYLGNIIRFGQHTKPEGSLVIANPNPQTEIYLLKGQLHYFDFDKMAPVAIPFTEEALEANEDSIRKFLANKYHQTKSSELTKADSKTIPHIVIEEVIYNEDGHVYADTSKYDNYKEYLIGHKRGDTGHDRANTEIPLTTDVIKDSIENPMIRSVYFTFSNEIDQIKDTATGFKKHKSTDSGAADAILAELEDYKQEIEKHIKSNTFNAASFQFLFDKLQLPSVDKGGERFKEKLEAFKKGELVIENEDIKKAVSATEYGNYQALVAILQIIEEVKQEYLAKFDTTETDEDGDGTTFSPEDLNNITSTNSKLFQNVDEEGDPDENRLFRTQVTGGEDINIAEAIKTLNRILPQVPLKIKDKLINGIAQGKLDSKGIIHLSKFAEAGTEYHEAFHALVFGILSKEERDELYSEAKKLYGKATQEELTVLKRYYPRANPKELEQIWLDEMLAEDFRTYGLSGGKTYPSVKVKGFFESLFDTIKAWLGFTESTYVNNIFDKLYSGGYANAAYDRLRVKQETKFDRFRPLVFKKEDPLGNMAKTKELVDGVTHYFFRMLFNENNSIADIIMKGKDANIDGLLEDAVAITTNELSKNKATPEITSLIEKLKNEESKKVVIQQVKEFLQRNLGIDLGLAVEVGEVAESDQAGEADKTDDKPIDESTSKTNHRFDKDATTMHPRESMSAFVKLLIASIPETVINEYGRFESKKGEFFKLPILVDPNHVMNNLLKNLHHNTTFDQMYDTLTKLETTFPYMNVLKQLLKDPANTAKDPLGSILLRIGFQQSMYKSRVSFKSWLLNDNDSVLINPSNSNQEDKILQAWQTNIIGQVGADGSIVTKDTGTKGLVIFNKAKIKANLDTLKKQHISVESFDYIVDALNMLGIPMTNLNYTNADKDIIAKNGGIILDIIKDNKKEALDIETFFTKTASGRLRTLATLEASRNGDVTDMTHRRVDGKSIYEMIEHNTISIISEYIHNMPVDTPISTLYSAFPMLDNLYTLNSHLLRNILFPKGLRSDAKMKINILEGARIQKPGEEGVVNTELDKADRTWMAVNSILTGTTPILRTADKATEIGIETHTGFNIKNIGNLTEIIKVFKGYLKDELAVGRDISADNVQFVLENKAKNGKNDLSDGIYFFADILKGKIPVIDEKQSIDEYMEEHDVIISDSIAEFIESEKLSLTDRLLKADIVTLEDTDYVWKSLPLSIKDDLGISGTTISEVTMSNIMRTVAVNSLIMNIEQTKLFFGHPGFYKSIEDLYKRTAGASGTKTVPIVDKDLNAYFESELFPKSRGDVKVKYNGRIDVLVAQEPVSTLRYIDKLKGAFTKEFGAKKAKEFIESFEKFDEADGQGYITLPEYREMMFRMGDSFWSRKHESLYHAAMSGKKLSAKDIEVYFNSVKAMHHGFHKMGNLAVPVYLKFSLMPLIPAVYKGTNMENIAESLMERGTGIMVYPSGVKVGALGINGTEFIPIYDGDGNSVSYDHTSELPTMSLDYRFMGVQVNTGFDLHKDVTVGTQQRKIILTNLYTNGEAKPITVFDEDGTAKTSKEATDNIVNRYNKAITERTKLLAKNLFNEIGAVEVGNGEYKIDNYKKLATFLKKSSSDKNATDNIIESFTLNKDLIRFKYIIDALPGRNKIENLLFSLVNNNVLSQKYNGGSKIQGASTGFERTLREYSDINKTIFKENAELRFYTQGLYGETLPMQVKLVADENLQRIIDAYDHKVYGKGREGVNKALDKLWELKTDPISGDVTGGTRYNPEEIAEIGLDPAIFQIVGFRIPTSELATTEMLEIAGFLDPLAGDVIHLPSALVAKSGGDYDIDKLTVYFNQLTKAGNLIVDKSINGLQNDIIYLTKQILTAPEMFGDLVAPVSAKELKDLANKFTKEPVSGTKSLTLGHSLDVGESFLVGKEAVAVIAKHTAHHPLAQRAGLEVIESYKNDFGEIISTRMNFKNLTRDFSLAKEWDSKGPQKGNKISQVLSGFLQAFVDVAKDPFIFRLNGNLKTADIYAYLIRRGVPLETAAYFMTQPVIKELYRRAANSQTLLKQNEKDDKGVDATSSLYDIIKELTEDLKVKGAVLGIEKLKASSTIELTEDSLSIHIHKDYNKLDTADLTYIYTQFQVLSDFTRYADQAIQLKEFMGNTSDDTIRSKNFNASKTFKNRETPKMFTEEQAEKFYDTTFLKGFKTAQYLTDVYKDIFISEIPTLEHQLDTVRTYLKKNKVTDTEINTIMDTLKNDLIVYSLSLNPGMNTRGAVRDYFTNQPLPNGKMSKSYPKRLLEIIKVKKNTDANPFLKNIFPLLDRPNVPLDNLKMFNNKMTTFEQNQLTNAYRALSAIKDGTALMQDGAVFAFLQSGLNTSPISWYDKLPIELVHPILKTGLINMRSSAEGGTFSAADFIHQFFRNNYNDNNLVPTVKVIKLKTNKLHSVDSTGVIVVPKKKHQNRNYVKVWIQYPQFAEEAARKEAKAAGIPTGEMLLFMKIGGNNFRMVPKQGFGMFYKEYHKNLYDSNITSNNPDTSVFKESLPDWTLPDITPFQNDNIKGTAESMLGEKAKKECIKNVKK